MIGPFRVFLLSRRLRHLANHIGFFRWRSLPLVNRRNFIVNSLLAAILAASPVSSSWFVICHAFSTGDDSADPRKTESTRCGISEIFARGCRLFHHRQKTLLACDSLLIGPCLPVEREELENPGPRDPFVALTPEDSAADDDANGAAIADASRYDEGELLVGISSSVVDGQGQRNLHRFSVKNLGSNPSRLGLGTYLSLQRHARARDRSPLSR